MALVSLMALPIVTLSKFTGKLDIQLGVAKLINRAKSGGEGSKITQRHF